MALAQACGTWTIVKLSLSGKPQSKTNRYKKEIHEDRQSNTLDLAMSDRHHVYSNRATR